MSVRAEQLSEILAALQNGEQANAAGDCGGLATKFEFWSGATGTCYVHSVFRLTDCPELPAANIILVSRDGNGHAHVRHVGQTTEASPSVNLAAIRQRASQLSASEVHVHFLGQTPRERSMIAFDLESALAEPEACDRGAQH